MGAARLAAVPKLVSVVSCIRSDRHLLYRDVYAIISYLCSCSLSSMAESAT